MLLVLQKIGKRQGWIPHPGTSRSRYSNNSGIKVSCCSLWWIWVPWWAFKVKLSPRFSFLLSGKYLLILQFMSVATWTCNSLTAGGFFFPSVKQRGAEFLPSPEGISFAQEIGKVFSSVSSLSLKCKYWCFFNFFFWSYEWSSLIQGDKKGTTWGTKAEGMLCPSWIRTF